MLARDAMTISPAVVTPNDPISRAAELMRDWDTGMIPVVTSLATMELIGVITDRDIVVRCLAAHDLPGCDVGPHMSTRKLVTVYPETPLVGCAHRMAESQVRRLPVVDIDGRLVGIVSLADVARKLTETAPALVAATLDEVSQPASIHV